MKPYVFFDLDGTVCNSAEGILNAVTYAVDRMGLPRQDRRQMLRFIGPPLSRTFAADYHLSEADTLRAVEFYREYYNTRGIFECSLFDGIPALLDRLSAAGYGLVLATCKPAASAPARAGAFRTARPLPDGVGTRIRRHARGKV